MNTPMLRQCVVVFAVAFLHAAPNARAAEFYGEPWRPQFHFTPATNWINDPNGMVFHDGEFHLFYQFNPFGDKWGHINVDHILIADAPARPATEPALWADFGPDFYAAVSWADVPKRDGRRLWIGWMSNWRYANDTPTSPWRGAMSVPRELALRIDAEGPRLVQRPVSELQRLRGKRHRLRNASLEDASAWIQTRGLQGYLLEVAAEFKNAPDVGAFGLTLRAGASEETRVVCDTSRGLVQLDRSRSGRSDFHADFPKTHAGPLRVREGRVALRLLVDTSSVEVFADDGVTVLTGLIFPASDRREIGFFSEPGAAGLRLRTLEIWELRSVWR